MMWRVGRQRGISGARWPMSALAALAMIAALASGGLATAVEQPGGERQAPPDVSATSHGEASPAKPSVCRTFRVREQDQVWVVSTRHLGCTNFVKSLPPLQFCRYENGWWQPKSAADFLAEQPEDGVTSFYIHGNQISHGQACSDGLAVYFQLAGKFDDEPPVRFVIWSWPSDRIKGPLNDVRTKAARSDSEALYLARFLEELTPEAQVGLTGYSFGARIVSGALHELGSASLSLSGEPSRFRVALWAAAEHNHWYLPGNYHQHALAAADAWFITINGCDPVLARYRFLEKCSDPCAVGYTGIYGRNLLPPDVNERVEEVNVSNIVGKTHDMEPYLYSLWIQSRTREYVLWHAVRSSPARELAVEAAN
jgi:hypothetical protein